MKSLGERAASCSGAYEGWMRSPGGEWEDLVGSVRIECVADESGALRVRITTIEFGEWTGRLKPGEETLEGATGDDGSYFRCTLREQPAAGGVRYSFVGGVYEQPAKLLFELRLSRRAPAGD